MITEQEGNRMISIFMEQGWWQAFRIGGYKPHWADRSRLKEDCLKLINLRDDLEARFIPEPYHSSWNLLMPVVEKIRSMHLRVVLEGESTEISSRGVEDDAYPWLPEFKDIYITSNDSSITSIEATWIAVVEFIQWYNKNIK